MLVIHGEKISFSYQYEGSTDFALEDIDISIEKGEFAAIIGHNGCGKSTLVKHFNALLELQRGELNVSGINVRDENKKWLLRRTCSMVFQNPDNQFVSSIAEEDIAFGLENYEVPRDEIPHKVAEALKLVGLEGFEKRSPHSLSGGQKQRLALAGVLVLKPDILIFDEVTSMLDPDGRREMLAVIDKLHREGKTIVMITHYVQEAIGADTVYLMHDGRMLAHGTPEEMLTDDELMRKTGLIPPMPVRIYYDLKKNGVQLERCPLTNEELTEEICRYKQSI